MRVLTVPQPFASAIMAGVIRHVNGNEIIKYETAFLLHAIPLKMTSHSKSRLIGELAEMWPDAVNRQPENCIIGQGKILRSVEPDSPYVKRLPYVKGPQVWMVGGMSPTKLITVKPQRKQRRWWYAPRWMAAAAEPEPQPMATCHCGSGLKANVMTSDDRLECLRCADLEWAQ